MILGKLDLIGSCLRSNELFKKLWKDTLTFEFHLVACSCQNTKLVILFATLPTAPIKKKKKISKNMTRAPNSPPCSVKESPFLSLKDSKVFLILPIINSVTIHHRRPTYEAKCWSVGLRSSDRKTGVCFSLVTHWVWTRLPSLWGNPGLQGDWAFQLPEGVGPSPDAWG